MAVSLVAGNASAAHQRLLQCMGWIDCIHSVDVTRAVAINTTRIVESGSLSLDADASCAVIFNTTKYSPKKCGPCQTRRLTGTAGARDLGRVSCAAGGGTY